MALPKWVKQVEVTGGTARQPNPVTLLTSGEKGVAHDDWVVIIQGGQFGSQGIPEFISNANSGWFGNQTASVASRSLGVWVKKVDDVEEFSPSGTPGPRTPGASSPPCWCWMALLSRASTARTA